MFCFFFSSRRRHTSSYGDWSSDVCSSDLFILVDTTVFEQREDGRVDEDELNVREVEEARLDARRHEHEEREHRHDPELADTEDEVDEPAGVAGDADSRRPGPRLGRHRHAAATSSCPVAAATIVSSE